MPCRMCDARVQEAVGHLLTDCEGTVGYETVLTAQGQGFLGGVAGAAWVATILGQVHRVKLWEAVAHVARIAAKAEATPGGAAREADQVQRCPVAAVDECELADSISVASNVTEATLRPP